MRSSIGKYQVLTTLGRGGMAEVFLVTSGHDGAGKLLVIKCMRSEMLADPELLGMFLDEARLAVRLNHPNIVQTFEVDSIDGEHFLAMEYLAGQPLNKLMNLERKHPGSLSLGMKLQLVCDGLLGLHAAHELCDYDGTPLNVVHRDVSPHNLFVTYDGVTKVVDFGIAKASGRSQQTKTGVTAPKGKVRYMAPEQGRGEKVDRRADLFAMGAILWELVTGLRFWEGKEELEIMFSLYQNQLPSLAVDGLDPALLAICSRAMASQRDQRYESAEQFRAALLRYTAALGEQVSAVDLGRRVQELFAEEKETLGRLIVERLSPAGRRPEALAASLTPPPVSGPRAALGSMTQTESGLSAPTQLDMVNRRRRAVTLGGGGAAVLVMGLLLSLRYLVPGGEGVRAASLSVAPSTSALPAALSAVSASAAPVISASAAPEPSASARATPEPTRPGKGKSSTNPGASARPPAGPVRTAGGAPTSPPLFLP